MRKLLPLLGLALIPLIAYAASSDDSYRECMRGSVRNREERSVAVTRNYHRNWDTILSDRKMRLENAWTIANDTDRKNIIRQAEKDVATLLRENDKTYKAELKVIQNDYRVEEKKCNDDLRDRDKARRNVNVGRRCFSTDECSPPAGICTLEFGDCRTVCSGDACRCSGICVLR